MEFREATYNDLEAIIALLSDDDLGSTREDTLPNDVSAYHTAFSEISSDTNNYIYVMCKDNEIIGVTQFFIMPHISRQGGKRAQIESVRVAKNHRCKGYGEEFMQFIISIAEREDCKIVQLTTDKGRDGAHRFYSRLGFEDSHIGMKLHLSL